MDQCFNKSPKNKCHSCGKEILWPFYQCVECFDKGGKDMREYLWGNEPKESNFEETFKKTFGYEFEEDIIKSKNADEEVWWYSQPCIVDGKFSNKREFFIKIVNIKDSAQPAKIFKYIGKNMVKIKITRKLLK